MKEKQRNIIVLGSDEKTMKARYRYYKWFFSVVFFAFGLVLLIELLPVMGLCFWYLCLHNLPLKAWRSKFEAVHPYVRTATLLLCISVIFLMLRSYVQVYDI